MDSKLKVILDLCGGTGAWSRPYKEAGYDVRVVTLPDYDVRLYPSKPSDSSRIPSDFATIENHDEVHGILCAPPCKVFAGSGARWPRSDEDMIGGLSIVDACIRLVHVLKPSWWALKNPIGKLRKWFGPPKFKFDPCDFGDPYTKKTLLWGDFTIPEKNEVEPIKGSKTHVMPDSKGRSLRRSITPAGFAKAFFEANK